MSVIRLAAIATLVPAWAMARDNPPGLTLPGSSGPAIQTCVQVQVAGQTASSLNCINQALQVQATGVRPLAVAPLDATSSSNRVGTFNEQGIAEDYGPNFGKSAIPFRPAPPSFNSALTNAH